MPSSKKLLALALTDEERESLAAIAQSRTEGFDRVRRARSLLAYSSGKSLAAVQRSVGISYGALSKCIKKALVAGGTEPPRDEQRCGRPRVIDEIAKAWVVALACTKPKELGYTAE